MRPQAHKVQKLGPPILDASLWCCIWCSTALRIWYNVLHMYQSAQCYCTMPQPPPLHRLHMETSTQQHRHTDRLQELDQMVWLCLAALLAAVVRGNGCPRSGVVHVKSCALGGHFIAEASYGDGREWTRERQKHNSRI